MSVQSVKFRFSLIAKDEWDCFIDKIKEIGLFKPSFQDGITFNRTIPLYEIEEIEHELHELFGVSLKTTFLPRIAHQWPEYEQRGFDLFIDAGKDFKENPPENREIYLQDAIWFKDVWRAALHILIIGKLQQGISQIVSLRENFSGDFLPTLFEHYIKHEPLFPRDEKIDPKTYPFSLMYDNERYHCLNRKAAFAAVPRLQEINLSPEFHSSDADFLIVDWEYAAPHND